MGKPKIMLGLTVFLLAACCVFAENESGNVGGDGSYEERHVTTTPFTTTYDTTYTLGASPNNGYQFITKNTSVSSGTTLESNDPGGASSKKTFTNAGDGKTGFSMSLSGMMGKPGGVGGYAVSWSVTAGTEFFYIKSNQDGGAKATLVPAGESVTYTAYENGGRKSSNWTISGAYSGSANDETSIGFDLSWWQFWNWGTPDITPPTPGVYNISASPVDGSGSDSGTMTVVGIDELQAKLRNATSYSSVNETLYVAVGDNLSVKAIIDPTGASWPSGTPEWSTSGDEWFSPRVSGVGETKTVDTSEPENGFTIKAECGTSEKTIDIAVYKCEFILYVQSPYGGPVGITGLLNKDVTVGHTFWQFKVSDFALSYLRNNDLQAYASSLNNKFGFHPDFGWNNPYRTSGPGKIENDNAHSYGKSKSYEINFSNLQSGLSQTHTLRSSPGTYTLGTRIRITDNGIVQHDATYSSDRNCTSVAKSVGSSAGISTPDSNITGWTTTIGTLSLLFSGNNPYTLNSNM